MVSIYCLRPVYTFLYTIINCNVAASFVQQISFEILWYKKIFLGYVRNLELPLPLVRNRTHLAWPLPLPHLRRTHYVEDPNECFAKISQQVSVLESLWSVCVGVCVVSFLIKLQAWCSATLWKRYFNTGLFLWVMQNFWEHIRWLILSVWLRLLLG